MRAKTQNNKKHYAKGLTASDAVCQDCRQKALSASQGLTHDCSTCPRRILIVGGIGRMEPVYRQLIEKMGDELEYHEGHLGSGGNKLKNSVQRADMVLCPVNCNSHSACLMVKKLCKKYEKHLHIMKNFSISAITRAVDKNALDHF